MAKKAANKTEAAQNSRGRPKKEFTEEQLEQIRKMAGYGLARQHIANIFDVCVDTLAKYAGEVFKKGESEGFGNLLEAAHIRALKGSDRLLEFLLKTRYGLSEKAIIENVGEAQPIPKIVFEVTQAGERRIVDRPTEAE